MDNEIYLKRKYKHFSEDDNLNEPLAIYNAKVHRDWIDYNGHMSEGRYECGSQGWAGLGS